MINRYFFPNTCTCRADGREIQPFLPKLHIGYFVAVKLGYYILKFRVKRAANLLKYSDATLSEISDYVCFNSQSHFGSVFKEYMKMTPRQYREKYKRKEFYS